MDSATSDNFDMWDLDKWSDLPPADNRAKQADNRAKQQVGRSKKRRRPLRKNRKPARPASYIGQRTNNRLLKICPKRESGEAGS